MDNKKSSNSIFLLFFVEFFILGGILFFFFFLNHFNILRISDMLPDQLSGLSSKSSEKELENVMPVNTTLNPSSYQSIVDFAGKVMKPHFVPSKSAVLAGQDFLNKDIVNASYGKLVKVGGTDFILAVKTNTEGVVEGDYIIKNKTKNPDNSLETAKNVLEQFFWVPNVEPSTWNSLNYGNGKMGYELPLASTPESFYSLIAYASPDKANPGTASIMVGACRLVNFNKTFLKKTCLSKT